MTRRPVPRHAAAPAMPVARRPFLAAFLATVLALPARAQSTTNEHLWASVFGEHRVNATWHAYWEFSARRHELGLTWQQQLGAFGVSRDLSPNWRLTGAMGWSNTFRYGETPVRSNAFELRPWLQVVGNRRRGRVTWTERNRVEMRNVVPYTERAPDDPTWVTQWRLRRMDRVVIPFRTGGAWYAAGSQEWFLLPKPTGAQHHLEQTRTQLLVGKALSPTLRIEGGYMLQAFWRQTTDEINHTVLVVTRWSAPIAR